MVRNIFMYEAIEIIEHVNIPMIAYQMAIREFE